MALNLTCRMPREMKSKHSILNFDIYICIYMYIYIYMNKIDTYIYEQNKYINWDFLLNLFGFGHSNLLCEKRRKLYSYLLLTCVKTSRSV